MATSRAHHTATLLLDGRVLLAGGYTRNGNDRPGVVSAELYVLNATPCEYGVSPANQAFDAQGGSGTIAVSSSNACSWSAACYDDWITLTSGSNGSGNGTVEYSVSANTATSPRAGTVLIAGQPFTVEQAAAESNGPQITSALIQGKHLIVQGRNFDSRARILLNGEPQKTKNDSEHPTTTLIGKKLGKKIPRNQPVTLHVRNVDGALSPGFSFTRL